MTTENFIAVTLSFCLFHGCLLTLCDTLGAFGQEQDLDGGEDDAQVLPEAGVGDVHQVHLELVVGGGIVLTVGIQNDGTVNGFSVVSYGGETIYKAFEPAFADQFKGAKVESFEKGTNLNYDSVAGASMTADAVKNACNAAITIANSLKGGA